MSAGKRRRTKNRRAAFVMGITEEEYTRRLADGELPYKLSMKRIYRILGWDQR